MRILVHGSQLLYPTNTGGRIRTSKLFERLARQHEITWVCFRRPDETDEQVEAMGAVCSRLETFPFHEPEKFSPGFYRELARNVVSPRPYVIDKYYHPAVRARLTQLVTEQPFDLLVCDFLQPSLNVLGLPFQPRILFEHNVESMIFERHVQERKALSQLPARAYIYMQWKKLQAYEARAARWFDHNIMVSAEDCLAMQRLYGVTNTSFIPTGVDADYFRPGVGGDESATPELVFTGSMDWLPNVDGITWFAEQVLPLIERQLPVKLWVVGRKPLPAVSQLQSRFSNIVVTGTVDDVRPYIARSRVYVVPIRIGGGTRMKIFEAMAMSKPVVSTRVGAEGLPVNDGKDIVLADEPAELARRVVELLQDEARRRALGTAGRKLVTENFSWDGVARRFSDICEGVVQHRMRGAA
jgi:glycosyltransferase involved in cell wall biosynthesis